MPPDLLEFRGRDAVAGFFATVPADGRLDTIHMVPARVNGQHALDAHVPDRIRNCQGYGIMVFTIAAGSVTTITGFPLSGLFDRFALAASGAPPALNRRDAICT